MNVGEILLSAQSADANIRQRAERILKEAEESNFAGYVKTLADHLAGDENNPDSRRLAGLIIKNCVFSRDTNVRSHLAERWLHTVDEQTKIHVRHSLLRALHTQAHEARRAAAQVIAKVAAIDVGVPGAWDSLITDLIAATAAQDDHIKQASLEALGYTCEEAVYSEVMERVLSAQSNQILTVVVHGMGYTGTDTSTPESASLVRYNATIALNNTLEFAKAQFEVPAERTAIITKLCEAAVAPEENIRQAAFEGLVKVAENYYDKLSEYIREIYILTERAIRNDVESVAMQAIEFWSTVAEEEVTIAYEIEASRDAGRPPEAQSQNFVTDALPHLSGPIFDSLKKQEDDPLGDSSWNTATAAGACVELLAQAAPDMILDRVKPFIEQNIQDTENWRSREAAILAFGSVLEGPPLENVLTLVREAMRVLIETLMRDPSLAVKDTTAWTLARVVMVDQQTTKDHLGTLVPCLRDALLVAENPDLAAHICFAIHNVADRFANEADQETGSLTQYIRPLTECLMQTADRDDAGEANLRVSAYESINALFRSVSMDGVPYIYDCVPMLLNKLQTALRSRPQALNNDEVNETMEHQGLLCGALTTATNRLNEDQIRPNADAMMEAYIHTMMTPGSPASFEDAFLGVGAMAYTMKMEFIKYMPRVMQILENTLSNLTSHQVFGVAVGVTGEVCRALDQDLTQFSEPIVHRLLDALSSTTLDRSVKPSIINTFGDIAISMKGNFHIYLVRVMECLRQAAESSVTLQVAPDDYDTQDWIQMLRESVLEAFVCIVSGLKDDGRQEMLTPQAEWVLRFCEIMVETPPEGTSVGDEMVRQIIALLGDMADAIPRFREEARQKSWMQPLIEKGSHSPDNRTKDVARWAAKTIFMTS